MLDLVIKNGLVVDGSGLPGFRGDVAITGGKITAVGNVGTTSARTIDARGRVIAPGFIDPHTHFDAQLSWDPHAQPSIEHGITAIVPGNCSLSLAPLRADQRDAFIRMFRQIEEMPAEDFGVGVDWAWGESFPGWTEHLMKRGLGIHVAPLVGHTTGELFITHERPTGRLTLYFSINHESRGQILRARQVAAEEEIVPVSAEPAAVEIGFAAAHAAQTHCRTGVQFRETLFPNPRSAIVQAEWVVIEGCLVRRQPDGYILIVAFVVHACGERVVKPSATRQRDDRPSADGLSTARHCDSAKRRNIAVLLHTLHEHAKPIDARNLREIIGGEYFHLLKIFRRNLEAGAGGVAQLPEIGVGNRAAEPKLRRIRGVAVV